MNNKKLTFFLLSLMLFGLTSCYYDIEEELYPTGSLGNCDTTGVTYLSDIRPIIDNKCATSGCHVAGGSAPGNYATYTDLKIVADNGKLLNRAITMQNMPPSAALVNCDQLKIKQWIKKGANQD